VQFIQYEGIAPKNILKLFKQEQKKHAGKIELPEPGEATPIFRPPLDSFSTYEKMVLSNLQKREG
jgi:hypothetical protein